MQTRRIASTFGAEAAANRGDEAMKVENRKTQLRCSIYTRVSSDSGLEQEFNSLDNQREASEAYIKSQAHEGWRLVRDHYDDGGFSGGSMERPALRKLLDDVARYVRVCQIVGIAGVEHRVKQLLLRREVVQQARRGNAGLRGDLPERGAAAAVARQQALSHGQDPLPPVLTPSEERGIPPLISHLTPSNQLNERTLVWFTNL